MKNNTIIMLLFLIAQVQVYNYTADDTCDTTCDISEFTDSCSSSAGAVDITSAAQMAYTATLTTDAILESDNLTNILYATQYLGMANLIIAGNNYLPSSTNYSPSGYYTQLQSLKGYFLPYTLSDNDALLLRIYQSWYDNIISKSFVTDASQNLFVIQSAISSVTSSVSSQTLTASDLSSQQCILNAQIKCFDDAITCLNAEVSQKNQDLETARQNAFTAFSNADLFIRGRLGVITNTSSIAYQLVDSDGEVLDTIAANSSSSNSFALSDYANSQQGAMFKLVPYDGTDEVVEDGSGEAFSYGGTFTVLCNSIGVNSEGNPYGYAQSVAVTRVYPSGATRAHVVDVSSIAQDNQYWEFNIAINPLPENTQFVYPRISAISTVTESLDVTVDFPTVLDATMGTPIEITQKNSSSNSYPSFDTDDYWSDVSA